MLRQRPKKPVPNERLERKLRHQGYLIIAGLDEVGRGAWAGPLVVGAVILPDNHRLLKLRDSKLMTRAAREQLARRIKKLARAWAVGVVEVAELNLWGLGKGLAVAAERAVAGLSENTPEVNGYHLRGGQKLTPDLALIDGQHPFRGLTVPQQTVIRGDQTVRSIAAAAIIAKVERDRLMRTLHRSDANVRRFRFDLNKGYPSPHHKEQLRRHGPSPVHRLGFAPVQAAGSRPFFIPLDKP